MSQPSTPPPPASLGTSSAIQTSTDGLPDCCTEEFRELLRQGAVPQFGCYDPIFLHRPLVDADTSSSAFFPPFSSLVRRYVEARDTPATTSAKGDDEDALGGLEGVRFGTAHSTQSWEHVTSAEDLWNGPPLTTKIPPAADYERILLDRS